MLSIEDKYNFIENLWKEQKEEELNKDFANDINMILKKYGINKTINHSHLIRITTENTDSIILSYFHNNDEDINKSLKNYKLSLKLRLILCSKYKWENLEE